MCVCARVRACVRACLASVIQHVKRMRRILVSSMASSAVQYFSTCLLNGTILGRKLRNMKCDSIFCTIFFSVTFLILRIIQRDTTINILDFHVKYSLLLSDFNETWIFSLYFRKILKCKIL